MSLTGDISNLIGKADALIETFENKSTEIDDKVASVIEDLSETAISIYVNAYAGDDNNDGRSVNKPVGTLEKALVLASKRSLGHIFLLSDVVMTKSMRQYLSQCALIGVSADGAYVRRKLRFLNEATNSPSSEGKRFPARLEMVGRAVIDVRYIDIELPDVSDDANWSGTVFNTGAGIDFFARNVSISLSGPSRSVKLLRSWDGPVGFWASDLTLGDGMPGRLISGLDAGANPNEHSSNRFRSNLTSV